MESKNTCCHFRHWLGLLLLHSPSEAWVVIPDWCFEKGSPCSTLLGSKGSMIYPRGCWSERPLLIQGEPLLPFPSGIRTYQLPIESYRYFFLEALFSGWLEGCVHTFTLVSSFLSELKDRLRIPFLFPIKFLCQLLPYILQHFPLWIPFAFLFLLYKEISLNSPVLNSPSCFASLYNFHYIHPPSPIHWLLL